MVISIFARHSHGMVSKRKKTRRSSRLSDIVKRSVRSVSSRRSLRHSSYIQNHLLFYLYMESKDPSIRIFRGGSYDGEKDSIQNIIDHSTFTAVVGPQSKVTIRMDDESDKKTLEKYLADDSIKCVLMLFLVSIETGDGNKITHANVLMINKRLKVLERFEPYANSNIRAYPEHIDRRLQYDLMGYMPLDYNYVSNIKIPCRAYQRLQELETKKDRLSRRPRGFCVAWATAFALYRINHLDKKLSEVDEILYKKIKDARVKSPTALADFIEDFSGKFLAKTEKFLMKSGASSKVVREFVRDPRHEFTDPEDARSLMKVMKFVEDKWNKYV